jgi:hypothetical protein
MNSISEAYTSQLSAFGRTSCSRRWPLDRSDGFFSKLQQVPNMKTELSLSEHVLGPVGIARLSKSNKVTTADVGVKNIRQLRVAHSFLNHHNI